MSFGSVELFQKRRDTAASLPPLRRACMNQDKSSRVEIPQYPRIFGWKLLSFKTISAPIFSGLGLALSRFYERQPAPASSSGFLFTYRFYIASRPDFDFGFTIPM